MNISLAEFDALSLADAHSLTHGERDRLLDLIIADGRKQATDHVSYRTGLYCDYYEEDIERLLKVRAVRVRCRGTTDSGFDGTPVGESDVDKYRAAFRHLETILKAAHTSLARVVTMVVFLTDMDQWAAFNEVYREFVPNPPCRAVIGTTGLAQKPLAIEFVECIAYRVAA